MAKKQVTSQDDNVVKDENRTKEQKYPSELLIKSEHVKSFGLHPDVIRAILVKQEYTIEDAKKSIKKYIDSFIG